MKMKSIINILALVGVNFWRTLFICLEPKAMDWFSLLPNHIRVKAIRNARLSGNLNSRYCSLFEAIDKSFDKSKSIEGELFWQRIADKYMFNQVNG